MDQSLNCSEKNEYFFIALEKKYEKQILSYLKVAKSISLKLK